MSEAARTVHVELRHLTLSESAELHEFEDAPFIALDDPPPVRTIIAVRDADAQGERRAFEVLRVVEVDEAERSSGSGSGLGPGRGVYGQWLEPEALRRFERVGTEHLSDGEVVDAEEEPAPEEDAPDSDDGVQMAVPAPVVDPDDSEPIDVDEARSIEADPSSPPDEPANEAASPADALGDSEEEDDEGEPEGESPSSESSRRRRKGRKAR